MGKKKKINNNGGKMCMICKRWFASGKAVGGHMKAHFVKLPIPPKPAPISPIADQVPLKVSEVDVNGGSSPTHQRLEQNIHPMNHQDFAERALKLVDDGQGSPESDQSYTTRKRFKRSFRKIDDPTTRALIMWPPSKTKVDEDNNPKQTGLIFDSCFPAIDAASTLMLLSKEKWPQGEELIIKKKQKVKDNENEQEDSYAEDHSHGSGRSLEYEMGTEVFGSYQALGGHKASHKKFKNDEWEVDDECDEENGDDVLEDPKVFKCPHCSKVLGSSQGLGRHKKIHFPNAMKFGANDIDLNLPAPVEDIDENSQDYD